MAHTGIEIAARVDALANMYSGRRERIREWYNLIRLEDDLKQDGMESVIGNDPRTSYNMASWLLNPKTWLITIDKENVSKDRAAKLVQLEFDYSRQLNLVESVYRGTLYRSFFKQIIRNFISTGWLTFSCYPTSPIWSLTPIHPASIYPEYDSEGKLIELGRKYTLSADEAIMRIVTQGWTLPTVSFNKRVIVRTLWKLIGGIPYYAVTMGNELVKEFGPYFYEPGKLLTYIPIYCSPGGGLPDDGTIIDNKWREEVGQSLVSSISSLQKNYDRMLTYMQQILRDTANAKWVQRVAGQGPLTPENVNRRGLVLTIAPGEDIYSPPLPALPPELRSQQLDIRNQIQRGSFPDISFGNFSAQVSVYLMSQATATAQQVLDPFQSGIKDAIGWVLTHFARMEGKLSEGEQVEFSYDIQIPGDFINRANTARILNPTYTVSKDTITRLLFPEIPNALAEASKIVTEQAMDSDVARSIMLINQMRQAAQDASSINDTEFSKLLNRGAALVEQRLFGTPDTTKPTQPLLEQTTKQIQNTNL